MITHRHPDHAGLVDRVRAESPGTWIAGHRAEDANVPSTPGQLAERSVAIDAWLKGSGVPSSRVLDLSQDAILRAHLDEDAGFDVFLDDGDLVPDTAGGLRAVHTPGHTAGHLCLRHGEHRLFFSGDHLLPRVTPNVSKRPGSLDDPIAAYVGSLAKVGDLGDDVLVLPGHEWAFDRPASRVRELGEHLRVRALEVVRVVEQGAETVWEVAQELSWSRGFDELNVRGQRQALGEAYAHLHRLQAAGNLRILNTLPHRWELTKTRL